MVGTCLTASTPLPSSAGVQLYNSAICCAPLVWLLPVNRSSSNLVCKNIRSSSHPQSKPSFTCLPICALICQMFSISISKGGRAAAFFFSFVHFLVDKACVQAVSHLLSVPFLSPTSQKCPLHQAVRLVLVCAFSVELSPLLRKELRSPRIRNRKQGPGLVTRAPITCNKTRSACVFLLVMQWLGFFPHSLRMAELPSEAFTLHLLVTLQNNWGT